VTFVLFIDKILDRIVKRGFPAMANRALAAIRI